MVPDRVGGPDMAYKVEENCHFEQEQEESGMLGMMENLAGKATAENHMEEVFGAELAVGMANDQFVTSA